MRKNRLSILIITLICIIVIILYLFILNFGYIKNNKNLIPTGNVDIFEIDCKCDDDKPVFNEDENLETDKDKLDINDFVVCDNYSMWGSEKVRIFSNPAYEYTSKIAPGSFNSYTFVIKNNNDFDIIVNFEMIEDNPYKVNMKYKLRSKGSYLVGDNHNYDDVSKLQLKNIKIKAHESISYILDWKWIDSKNDTLIGERIEADYKLTINVSANQIY